jgi:CRP/FNR family cyclic AMP-dependent transcriptional regulator
MSILAVVKGSPLFYELYDEEILKIVEKCRVLNLQPGDKIFSKGEEGNDIYLVLNGSASVKKGDITLAKLRKGDLFGEMVLLKDNQRYADVVVENFADILVVNYNDIFGMYDKDNKIFSILMLNLARMLATRLKKAGEAIGELKEEIYELKDEDKAA